MAKLGLRYAVPVIISTLKANTSITSLVSANNIFPLIKSIETTQLPAIAVKRVGWSGNQVKSGVMFGQQKPETLIIEEVSVQVEIYANDYDAVNEICEKVTLALYGQQLTAHDFTISDTDLVSTLEAVDGPDYKTFIQTLTFSCTCKTVNNP